MRNLRLCTLFAITLLVGCGSAPPPLGVMTFNVLCSFCDPSYDPWDDRLRYFGDLFERHDPDLAGLQELALAPELDQLEQHVRGYTAIFYDEGEGGTAYPDATILYRTSRFDERERGFFWLSPTPDDPFSTGFANGRQLPRLVAWARLYDREAEGELVFVTTHFDNNSPSQERSAPLFLERLAQHADVPLIVTGDFNSQPRDPAFATLVGAEGFHLFDTFDRAAEVVIDSNQTPVPEYDRAERIDHIFVSDAETVVMNWTADLRVYGPNARYPSDHRALVARIGE